MFHSVSHELEGSLLSSQIQNMFRWIFFILRTQGSYAAHRGPWDLPRRASFIGASLLHGRVSTGALSSLSRDAFTSCCLFRLSTAFLPLKCENIFLKRRGYIHWLYLAQGDILSSLLSPDEPWTTPPPASFWKITKSKNIPSAFTSVSIMRVTKRQASIISRSFQCK